MEHVNCDLCGSDDWAVLKESKFLFEGSLMTNVICKKCTLVYMSPRWSVEEYRLFYSSSRYRVLRQGSAEPTAELLHTQREEAKQIVQFFKKKRIEAGAMVLDIGCANGELLAEIRRRFDVQAVGVEPYANYAEYGESVNKLTIFNTTLEEFQLIDQKADIVILSHTLEHFNSPRSALLKVRSMINETGWLYVQVPNLFAHKSFQIAHLSSFYTGSLITMLASAGFETVQAFTHGSLRQRWPRYFLSVFAKPGSTDNIPYPRVRYAAVVRQRKLGRTLARSLEVAGLAPRRALRHLVGDQLYQRLKNWYRTHGKGGD